MNEPPALHVLMADMDAYDLLPPRVREALRESPNNLPGQAQRLLKLHQGGWPETNLVNVVRRTTQNIKDRA